MDGVSLANISIAFLGLFTTTYALLTRGQSGISYASTPLIVLSITVSIITFIAFINFISIIHNAMSMYEPFWQSRASLSATMQFLNGLALPSFFLASAIWLNAMVLTDLAISKYFRVERILLIRRLLVYPYERLVLNYYRDNYKPNTPVSDIRGIANKFFYGKINEKKEIFPHNEKSGYSVSILYSKPKDDQFLDDICALIIQNIVERSDNFFEIVCCIRHPIEILDHLDALIRTRYFQDYLQRHHLNNVDDLSIFLGINSASSRMVFIDAHTEHFGFDEPVYYARSRQVKQCGLTIIKSSRSFPGIHSALVKGMKNIKSKDWFKKSNMGVVIFDELCALTDIDSLDRYKIFIRHVISSEHLMGGMMTVFCEFSERVNRDQEIIGYFDHYFDVHHAQMDIAFPTWLILTELERIGEEIIDEFREAEAFDTIVIVPVLSGGAVVADVLETILRKKLCGNKLDRSEDDQGLSGSVNFERFNIRVSKYREAKDFDAELAERPNFAGADFDGKYVLIVDDICDRGTTISCIRNELAASKAHVRFAVVLNRAADKTVDFTAIEYDDFYPGQGELWMYGFGMDSSNDGIHERNSRNLPCIAFESSD